jgi:hypothetical protein
MVRLSAIQRVQYAADESFFQVMSNMDGSSSKRKEAKGKSKAAFEKLGLKEPLQLNEHEEIIMGEVIGADDIAVNFAGRSTPPCEANDDLTCRL